MNSSGDTRVKKRLLLPILLALFLLTGIAMSLFYYTMNHHLNEDIEDHATSLKLAFASHIHESSQTMVMLLEVLSNNEKLKKNWRMEDRESLQQNALPLFKSIQPSGAYTLFFAHPDKTIFLRVHKPDKYGDSSNTWALGESLNTLLPSSGVSTCTMKKIPVLQTVIPWKLGNRVAGFIGVNNDIFHFAKHLQSEFHVGLLISTIKNSPEDADTPTPVPIGWPQKSHLTPIFSTLDTIPPSVSNTLDHFLSLSKEPFTDILIEGKKYRVTSFPLSNGAGEDIAIIALLHDITEFASFQDLMIQISIALAIASCGAFFFFYVFLGRIDKQLIQGRANLEEALQSQRVTSDELNELKTELEEKVKEQTSELTEVNISLSQKVAEAERAKEETRDAYNELEQILQTNSSGMRVLDTEQRVTRVNLSFEKLIGLSQDELLGSKCSENFQCPKTKTPDCCAGKILSGEEYEESELEIIRKDGSRIWINHTAAPFRDTEGQLIGIVQNFQDITVRKKAELSVLQANEQWEETFNAMGDIVTIHDTDMRIVRANKAAMDMLGLAKEELIGRTCYSVFRGAGFPCEGCPEADAKHDYTLHTAEIEHPNLQKTLLVSASPIIDNHGSCIGVIHVAKDVTEQKNLETKLSQAQKMEAIGTLAGGIAHDFNNILSAIYGYTIFVQESLVKGSQPHEDLHQVIQACDRATDLVKQILAFSHQAKSKKSPLEPALIIKDVLKFLRSSLPSSIEIRQNITTANTKILANPTQIYQVVMNLCINASHAMEKDGGILEIKLAEMLVNTNLLEKHSLLNPGKYLSLSVSDTGCGIAVDNLDKIFDPFFTTKEKGKGTGMGLAVVHGIVKDHGGDITVRSRPGKGTVFQMLFPATEQDETNIVVAESVPLPGKSERILAVDDEEPLARMLCRLLESLGYEVVVTTDSVQAFELFQEAPDSFDMVISDQTMPNLKGTQLADKLRSVRPDIPIIICSGYSEDLKKQDINALGIDSIIKKPFRKNILSKTIRQILDA